MAKTKEFKCTRCKKQFKCNRNLQQHQGRRICEERRNPRLRLRRLEDARVVARARDAERKRARYVPKLPQCDFCMSSVRAWVISANCEHRIHRTCYYEMCKAYNAWDPVLGKRDGDPPCPYCRETFTQLL